MDPIIKHLLYSIYGATTVMSANESLERLYKDYAAMYRSGSNEEKKFNMERIKNVIFNDPATIVFWHDGTKTVVVCKNEPYDPEKGLAMAFSKKLFGNKGYYYDIFRKWLPEKGELEDECLDCLEQREPYGPIPCDSCRYEKVDVIDDPCDRCFNGDHYEAK